MANSTTKDVTYLGRRARVTTTEHGGDERTVITEWIDDADPRNGGYPAGTITSKRIKGDGRTQNFEIIEPTTIISGPSK